MKKRLFVVCVIFALMFVFSLGSVSVYANEMEDTEIIIEVEEETEAEEYVTQVVEYIIAGVLGLLGTTGVAVLFRSQLKKLINSILDGIKALWKNKENAEEELNAIKNNVDSTLASLQNVKEELFDTNKHEFEALSKKVNLLCEVVLYMAGGMKELVINGTAESISDALKQIDGEVIDNASKEV